MATFPFEQQHKHFTSGVNRAGEVSGLFLSGRWVGVTAGEVKPALLEELLEHGGVGPSRLFVDSGAFSEVIFTAGGPRVNPKKELTPAKWASIFALYETLAGEYRTRCYVVAPDRIADQVHSLELLTTYAPRIAVVASLRAQIIIPVQKGELSMGDYFTRAQAILGLRERREDSCGLVEGGAIAGIPMKKDATTLAELASFVDTLPAQHSRIHLLGMGPASKGYAAALEVILSRRPDCLVTSDSTARRLVGRTNGPKGTPRALTLAQDIARAAGHVGAALKQAALQVQGGWARTAQMSEAAAMGWVDEDLVESTASCQLALF